MVFCVAPAMRSQRPWTNSVEKGVRIQHGVRGLKARVRVPPRERERMQGLFPSSFSSSECQLREEDCEGYKLIKTELKAGEGATSALARDVRLDNGARTSRAGWWWVP